ncbi:hypothetical protein BDD12DRAFT_217601 [Trichophaea hybrida]|nr:hypothetical protein BDD12DRAFT_217601 [Trichophaea hybrida]
MSQRLILNLYNETPICSSIVTKIHRRIRDPWDSPIDTQFGGLNRRFTSKLRRLIHAKATSSFPSAYDCGTGPCGADDFIATTVRTYECSLHVIDSSKPTPRQEHIMQPPSAQTAASTIANTPKRVQSTNHFGLGFVSNSTSSTWLYNLASRLEQQEKIKIGTVQYSTREGFGVSYTIPPGSHTRAINNQAEENFTPMKRPSWSNN